MSRPTFELALLKIPVSNIMKATAFYRDVLGMDEQFAVEEYGWAQLLAGALPVALYKPGMGGGDGTPGATVGFHLALSGSDFDKLAKGLGVAGALVDDQVYTGDDGTTFLEARDPDANKLKITRNSSK
jgi:catechol 2,3-dioxygenase-like lactoylglutathione lyase family enzyme